MSITTPIHKTRAPMTLANTYAYAWVVLAGVALSYLLTVAFYPAAFSDGANVRSDAELNDGQKAAGRFATDMSGVMQSVAEIKQDVQSVRAEIVAAATREKGMAERVMALEERAKPPSVAELNTPVAPRTATQRQAEARALKASAVATATQAPPLATASPTAPSALPTALTEPAADIAPPPRVVVLNAAPQVPATNPVVTGALPSPTPAPSAAAPSVTFGPGAVTPIATKAGAGPSAVELSSGPSLDALRLNWSLLADRHPAALKNLEARYMSAGDGSPYQLLAGPINTADEATRVCAQLKARKVACRVTGFAGNAL